MSQTSQQSKFVNRCAYCLYSDLWIGKVYLAELVGEVQVARSAKIAVDSFDHSKGTPYFIAD